MERHRKRRRVGMLPMCKCCQSPIPNAQLGLATLATGNAFTFTQSFHELRGADRVSRPAFFTRPICNIRKEPGLKKASIAFLLSLAVVAGAETFQMPSGGPVNRPVPMKRSEGGAVRVCTYNIGWAAGSPSHPGCWASRRADVAALVCSSSPDVVAFQEVVPAQAGYLRGKMPEYGFAGEYRNEDRTSGQGNLVAWRRDRFDLVETRTFWLSETPDVPGSKSWGSGWRRTCTLAALRASTSTAQAPLPKKRGCALYCAVCRNSLPALRSFLPAISTAMRPTLRPCLPQRR